MKLSDVVLQLLSVLPKYTDYFSKSISFNSIVAAGGVATINAPDHGLADGKPVTLSDFGQNTPITAVSKDGLVFTFTTDEQHDLTYGYPGYETVELGGFTDVDWNDSFNLVDVPDRLNFKVQSANSLPVLNGNEYLIENRIDGLNGRYPITEIDDDNFSISGDFVDGDYSGGSIKAGVRIAGTVDIERALEQYTKQELTDLWMFVEMNDVAASKNRNALSDATATIAQNEDIRTRMIDGFSVFIVKNVKNETAAVQASDIARHDLLEPICKSLFGARFDTGLSGEGDFFAIIIGHNFVRYNRSYFVYQYNFELVYDLTLEDAVINEDTRAFSELEYTHSVGGDDTDDLTFDTELPNG